MKVWKALITSQMLMQNANGPCKYHIWLQPDDVINMDGNGSISPLVAMSGNVYYTHMSTFTVHHKTTAPQTWHGRKINKSCAQNTGAPYKCTHVKVKPPHLSEVAACPPLPHGGLASLIRSFYWYTKKTLDTVPAKVYLIIRSHDSPPPPIHTHRSMGWLLSSISFLFSVVFSARVSHRRWP